MSDYRKEFPNFDTATMPAIPADWIDTSWHIDTCPSFMPRDPLQVFIDHADESLREMPGLKRFAIMNMDDQTGLLDTDDWNEVLAFVASRIE